MGRILMTVPVYLDNNATTRPLDAVIHAVDGALRERWHNPSSMHRAGQEARGVVELARRRIARLIGAEPGEITFTSGATEAIDLGIRGVLAATSDPRRTVLTTSVEHEAVRDCLASLVGSSGVRVALLPLTPDGAIDPKAIEVTLDEHAGSAALAVVQWANNETGIIQPVAPLGAACRARGIPLLVDGTQWVGKMPTAVDPLRSTPELGGTVDLLAFSAHKLHGPKGVGALYARRGVRLEAMLRGVQERERRGGTENVPGIAGFGAAAELAMVWLADHGARASCEAMARRFEAELLERLRPLVPGARINAGGGPRLWNTINLALPGLESEALVLALSERGVAVSAGAACASGSVEPSPVLAAMGLPEPIVAGSIRLSTSRLTSEDELALAGERIEDAVRALLAASETSQRVL